MDDLLYVSGISMKILNAACLKHIVKLVGINLIRKENFSLNLSEFLQVKFKQEKSPLASQRAENAI